jgi:hypothetical protein
MAYTTRKRRAWWRELLSLRWLPPITKGDLVQPGQLIELSCQLNRWFRPDVLTATEEAQGSFLLVAFTIDGEPQLPSVSLLRACELTSIKPRQMLMGWCPPGREITLSLRNVAQHALPLMVSISGEVG